MNSTPVSRILCPTDFSEVSAGALLHALALARTMGAALKIVHVIHVPDSGAEAPYWLAPWVVTSEVRDGARAAMSRFLAPARAARIDHESEIREGNPWREILAAAQEGRADTVVLGTHGRTGIDRLLIGSVAEKMIRRLPCSVMSVGPESARRASPPEIKRVLIATDFSPYSLNGLGDGLAIARKSRAEVTVLHVIDPVPDPHAHPEAAPLREALLQEGVSRLKQALEEAGAEPWVTPRIAFGRPYAEILNVAASGEVDLIVMGAQGHGLLEGLTSGSNTQHVIRGATCPVFVARHHAAASSAPRVAAMLAPVALCSALT